LIFNQSKQRDQDGRAACFLNASAREQVMFKAEDYNFLRILED